MSEKHATFLKRIRLPVEHECEDFKSKNSCRCELQEDKDLLRELEAKFNELLGSTDDD